MPPVQLESLLPMLVQAAAGIAAWGLVFLVLEGVLPWVSTRLAGRGTASWRLQRDVGFFKRDFLLEYSLPLLNQLLGATLFVAPVYALHSLLHSALPQHVVAPWVRDLPLALQIFYAMLVMDLAIYAEHRFSHRFAWPFHSVHHAARDVTWLTAFRIHPVNSFTLIVFNSVVGWVLGFSGDAWVIATTVVLFLGMFQHANLNWDWGMPLRYLIVSPNYHKWHHVKSAEIGVKNLCLVFPFLDVLFGTFYFPRDEKPREFGIYQVEGEEPMPSGFFAQVWYPIGRCLRALGSWPNATGDR